MRLRLTTWNLQGHKGLDVDAVAAHLQQTNSDVVLLQEVQRRQARRVAEILRPKSLRWSFKHWSLRTPAEGMAMLGLSEPVTDVRSTACTRRWNPLSWRRRIIQLGSVQGLRLVNVHLSPHDDGSTMRQREVAWLLNRGGRGPCVIAGDLNAEPEAGELDCLRKDGWTEAGTAPTNWRGRRDVPPTRRIDYVWASPDLMIADATVPSDHSAFASLSDHLPLSADITSIP